MKKINDITELVFIIDRSGSMSGLEKDTIGGFNSMIKKQKKRDGRCYVSTILFDHEMLVLHDRVRLDAVKPMTDADYEVRGCTALLDAVGDTIRHIADIHRYGRKEDIPHNTMFVIITDGIENASHKYSAKKIKTMIELEKKKYGWEFLFIGANIDAVETASEYGIDAERAVDYRCDSRGTEVCYDAVCNTITSLRNNMPIADNWSECIKKDLCSRI